MTLCVESLSYKYTRGNPVLKDVSLQVDDGELVALVGPSGCGKSTLLHCIAGLIAVDAGEISINGISVRGKKTHERGVGIVMQDQPLYEHLSVKANVGFPLKARGEKRLVISKRVAETLEALSLTHVAARKASQVSGGERRRIALGRAIIVQPSVLLLDEPLVSLDEELRRNMQQLIRKVHHETNASTLLVTHDVAEATNLADRIVYL